MKVAVLGASPKPERYSHQAVSMLHEYGYDVVPVNPAHQEILGIPVVADLDVLEPGSVDTVTVYIGSNNVHSFQEQLLRLAPKRVIFNPGTENEDLMGFLKSKGIEVLSACTLVLLRTGRF